MRTPSNLDASQASAFTKWRTILFGSLWLWTGAATVFLASAEFRGSAVQRIENVIVPSFICIVCCLVIVMEPLFAATFVLTTMALTAAASILLVPIFLMLLLGWGGSARSAEDSRLLYSLIAYWITNALALAAGVRYTKILWPAISMEKVVYGCLAPFVFVVLSGRIFNF